MNVMYFLAATRCPAGPSGANAVLVWDAMQLAEARGLILDLDGYKTSDAAHFYAGFGLPVLPRTVIRWCSARYAAAEALQRGAAKLRTYGAVEQREKRPA